MSHAAKVINKLRRKGAVICEVFDDASWKHAPDHLAAIGLPNARACKWREMSKTEAIDYLAKAISVDLCYSDFPNNEPRQSDRALVTEFLESFHW